MAVKINLKTSTVAVDIAGDEYHLDFSDENLRRYEKQGQKIKARKDDPSVDSAIALLKESLDLLLGEGAADAIYPKIGNSSYVAADVVDQLLTLAREKAGELRRGLHQYYTGKPNRADRRSKGKQHAADRPAQ